MSTNTYRYFEVLSDLADIVDCVHKIGKVFWFLRSRFFIVSNRHHATFIGEQVWVMQKQELGML